MYMLDEVRVENLRIPGDQYKQSSLKKSKLLQYRESGQILIWKHVDFVELILFLGKSRCFNY